MANKISAPAMARRLELTVARKVEKVRTLIQAIISCLVASCIHTKAIIDADTLQFTSHKSGKWFNFGRVDLCFSKLGQGTRSKFSDNRAYILSCPIISN